MHVDGDSKVRLFLNIVPMFHEIIAEIIRFLVTSNGTL